tara:strand:- start:279 stop:668 length:390 start_codon:yes stop_codon:yes gene_type:complete
MLSPDVENILELQKKRTNREEQLKQKMLNSVKEKINNYANFGQTACIYKIPNFLIGEIPFEIETIHKFLVKKLKNEGFYVINMNVQYIYISWDIKDINKVLKEKKSKIHNKQEINNNFSAFANMTKKTF